MTLRRVLVSPAVVMPAPATVAPRGMPFVAVLLVAAFPEAGCGRRPCMRVGEVSPSPGHVRVSPMHVVAGISLTQGHPAQGQQRHEACQN